MNAGTLLKVLRDVIDALEADGILKDDGSFDWPDDVSSDVKFAVKVEEILKAHGAPIGADLDKVLQALPLFLLLLKIK